MKKNKGFTLIELMVVVAIITLLTVVVLVSLNESRIRSAKAAFKSEAGSLVSSVGLSCTGATIGSAILPAIPVLSKTKTPSLAPTCTGNGTFSFVVTSKDSSSGSCYTSNSIITQDRVTYPPGC